MLISLRGETLVKFSVSTHFQCAVQSVWRFSVQSGERGGHPSRPLPRRYGNLYLSILTVSFVAYLWFKGCFRPLSFGLVQRRFTACNLYTTSLFVLHRIFNGVLRETVLQRTKSNFRSVLNFCIRIALSFNSKLFLS